MPGLGGHVTVAVLRVHNVVGGRCSRRGRCGKSNVVGDVDGAGAGRRVRDGGLGRRLAYGEPEVFISQMELIRGVN